MRRALRVKHNNDTANFDLEIGKAVSVDTDKEFIYFEKMSDGKWRLTFSKAVVADFSTVNSFEVIRED